MAVYLNIDISDAKETIDKLRLVHSPDEMKKLLYRAVSRTGRQVRTIIKTEVPKDYEVKPTWVASHVKNPKISYGGGGLGVKCVIPIDGHRGSVGGRFGASGGSHGWNAAKKGGKRYKIKAKIVKGTTSTMPETMKRQGGNPPFRNLGSSLGGVTFTRVGKGRFPIARVVGIGVPQMPMNRSQDDVQKQINETLIKRLEHEHKFLISRCR